MKNFRSNEVKKDLWAKPTKKLTSNNKLDIAFRASVSAVPSRRPAAEVIAALSYNPSAKSYEKAADLSSRMLRARLNAEKFLDRQLSFPKSLLTLKTSLVTDKGWEENEIGGEPPNTKLPPRLSKRERKLEDKKMLARKLKEKKLQKSSEAAKKFLEKRAAADAKKFGKIQAAKDSKKKEAAQKKASNVNTEKVLENTVANDSKILSCETVVVPTAATVQVLVNKSNNEQSQKNVAAAKAKPLAQNLNAAVSTISMEKALEPKNRQKERSAATNDFSMKKAASDLSKTVPTPPAAEKCNVLSSSFIAKASTAKTTNTTTEAVTTTKAVAESGAVVVTNTSNVVASNVAVVKKPVVSGKSKKVEVVSTKAKKSGAKKSFSKVKKQKHGAIKSSSDDRAHIRSSKTSAAGASVKEKRFGTAEYVKKKRSSYQGKKGPSGAKIKDPSKRKKKEIVNLELLSKRITNKIARRLVRENMKTTLFIPKKKKPEKKTNEVKNFGERYEFSAPPILLPEEIKGNLRTTAMAYHGTNPISERFHSLVKRNIIPTADLTRQKKPTPKARRGFLLYGEG